MSASQFVGRVGGLAVSLGIGAAVMSGGIGVAFADAGSQSDNGTASADNGNANRTNSHNARRAGTKAGATASRRSARASAKAADAVDVPTDAPVVDAPPPIVTLVDPVVDPAVDPVDLPVVDDSTPIAYSAPPEVQRTSATPSAKATSRLSAAPVTTYFDGVLQGNLNVTSTSGCGELGSTCKLEYSFVGSSDGGKANLGNVPVTLPGGGAESYTFLPYANWILPNSPTKFPVATGTQDFSVRITENTKFDQRITSIPLVGMIAKPIIKLMQDLPLISNLLAPLIGASLVSKVEVNVGDLAAGRQVAYTYTISSFDGTPISMNYFPASAPSLLAPLGNQQATIFNGPGLGSPGTTDPYATGGLFGSSVPPVGLMRGQGLPAPFDKAPVGFNVITWDPRGEYASGGELNLDNPFIEGRDVSSLMTWANANTPLLNEPDRDADGNPISDPKPDIAMMGGSYGGGIQMTTVDPRIKTVVPSIAWNSLNESLYPNNVFKSGWGNTLALFLLQAGARPNPMVNEAVIGANLTGRLTPEQQALLASSGPTVLLSKLSIPTLYNQGTIDALFPLQQAIDNARTQLDQNPFFTGVNPDTFIPNADLVKMIWFCGGHGVCTDQTVAQQTAQSTIMFLEDILWANNYTKGYLNKIPIDPPLVIPGIPVEFKDLGTLVSTVVSLGVANFQWWDQTGRALASFTDPACLISSGGVCGGMPWTPEFQNSPPITATNTEGGRITWFNSRSGPLSTGDPAAQFDLLPGKTVCDVAPACSFPLNNAFATEAENAVNVPITVPALVGAPVPGVVVGAPLVTMTYSGTGRAKAVYGQIVDNATGQVLGNINTPIPVTLDGKEHTITAFPIANIAYTAPSGGGSLTLQIVGRSSNFKAQRLSVDISSVSVSLPTTTTAVPNPIGALLPS